MTVPDYSDYPPRDETPAWDEYTVSIDGVEFPTYQIDDLDGDGIIFAVEVVEIMAFKPFDPRETVEVETPEETFTGTVGMVAVEHYQLTIRIERLDEEDQDGDDDV